MAKSNQLSAAVKSSGVSTLINTHIEITGDSLITVAVSKAERKIQADLKGVIANVKACESDISKAKDNHQTSIRKHGEEYLIDALAAAKTFLKLMKSDSTAKACCQQGHDNGDPNIRCAVVIGKSNDQYSRSEFVTTIPLTKEHKRQAEAILDSEKVLEDLRLRACECKKQLANLPTLERQVRARLVENQLNTTVEGRDLLARLELGSLDSDIKLLG